MYTTTTMIDEMVEKIGATATDRERHWMRQSLLALVRLSKAEQLLQMKMDVQAAVGKSIARD